MNLIPARIQTIVTSVAAWLILATVVLQGVIDELGSEFPDIVSPLARVVTVIGGIVLVIRRVTPVVEGERGLVSTR